MRILYNTKKFPLVRVKVTNDTDDNNECYNKFMSYWNRMYKERKHFHFLMNLESLTRPNVGLCIDFIKNQIALKDSPIQYLDYSVVVISNSLIKNILNSIWKICPPLNTVYLVTEMAIGLKLLSSINNPMYNDNYIECLIEMYNITKI